MEKLYDKIDKLLDLNVKDPDMVSSNIFKCYNLLQLKHTELSQQLIEYTYKMERLERKQLDTLKHDVEYELNNKSEYDIYMKGDKVISQLRKKIRLLELEVDKIEKTIKMVMNMNNTIRNYIEWQKFQEGL